MSTSPTSTPTITAALVSVGGSPAPVLHVLRQYRPQHVWYFCSSSTRPKADEIHSQLDWHPAPRFIEVERFEELGPCYRELRRKIPDILAETKVNPAEVLVDYTGGTKTMSVALVLAAVELFQQFSYVGAKQRDKGGLGIVVDGQERTLYQANPWSELAIREVERARDLWDDCQFDVAANLLRSVAPRVPLRLRFKAIADLADAMAARHRLDFSSAKDLLARLQDRLPMLLDGCDDHGLLAFAQQAKTICHTCAADRASDTLLRELLDNALRTAGQGRYEDAAARLYRAMEMQAQLWLADATGGLFTNGRCKPQSIAKLPPALTALPFCHPDDRGEIRLSLEQCFLALDALGHEPSCAVAADIALERKSRFRAATEKRNTSILAHGVRAIGKDGFEQMKQIATEFLGFDLSREANPIPPLDPRWLE
jgi:CRISPR-associated protein (TIGR02710 family)